MGRKLKIPYGFQDYLPNECYAKRQMERCLSEIYRGYGYNEVETPTVEYYDAFHDVYAAEKLKKMFKLTDNDGSLLALRPDITLQICRMASKMDLSGPQRLYYAENCFEYLDNSDTARTREFAQIGVELIGESGLDGEIEIIALAIKSFLALGLSDFKIELGNSKFFKGIISDCGLGEEDVAYLTDSISRKDAFAVESFIQSKKLPSKFSDKLLLLPTLFGGGDVFDRAKTACDNELSLTAYENIEKLYTALKVMGYEQYISVDFGMLHGFDYYSGLIIKGYSENFGLCILDGGRYDDLCPSFGFSGKAVGFAIGVKRLLAALSESGKINPMPPCDFAYFCDNAVRSAEMNYVESLQRSGRRVVKLFCESEKDLFKYCRNNNITRAFCIRGEKVIEFDEKEILCQT